MTALLSAELLKLRTTRMVFGLLGALLLFVAIVTLVAIITTNARDLEADQEGLFASPVLGIVFVLVMGVMLLAGEFRHGTITQTLLVTPSRWTVLAAKIVTGALLGLSFAIVAELFALVLGVPLLMAKGVDVSFDHDATRLVGGTIGAMTIAAMLGVGLGTLIRNQVAAIISVFGWVLLIEPVLNGAMQEKAKYAPGQAIAAIVGDSENLLSPRAAVALALAYAAALTAVGGQFVFSRDVNSIQS
jgi:ABC-2 type transport system permease protein